MKDKEWIQFHGVEIHKHRPCLRIDGDIIHLEDSEYKVICKLSSAPAEVFDKQLLLAVGWPHQQRQLSCVKACISGLRKKLDDSVTRPHLIKTVGRQGYQWIGQPVVQTSSPFNKARILVRTVIIVAVVGFAGLMHHAPIELPSRWLTEKLKLPEENASSVKRSWSGDSLAYQDRLGELHIKSNHGHQKFELAETIIDYQWHPQRELLTIVHTGSKQHDYCQLTLLDLSQPNIRWSIPCPPGFTMDPAFMGIIWQAENNSLLLSDVTKTNHLQLYRYKFTTKQWLRYADYQLNSVPKNIALLSLPTANIVVVRDRDDSTQVYKLEVLPKPLLVAWLDPFKSIDVAVHESAKRQALRYLTPGNRMMIVDYPTQHRELDNDYLSGLYQLNSMVDRHLITSRIPAFQYVYTENLQTPLVISEKSVSIPIPRTAKGRYLLTTTNTGIKNRDQIVRITPDGNVSEIPHRQFSANTINSFDINGDNALLISTREGTFYNGQLIVQNAGSARFVGDDEIIYLKQFGDQQQLFQQKIKPPHGQTLVANHIRLPRAAAQGYCYLKTNAPLIHCQYNNQTRILEVESIPHWLDYRVNGNDIVALVPATSDGQLVQMEFDAISGKLNKQTTIINAVAIADPIIRRAIDYVPIKIEHHLSTYIQTHNSNRVIH